MTKEWNTPHKCLVCGQTEFPRKGSYKICQICGWEDDSLQEANPDYDGGANDLSLNENRKRWANGERAI